MLKLGVGAFYDLLESFFLSFPSIFCFLVLHK